MERQLNPRCSDGVNLVPWPRAFYLLTAHARRKWRALERTGSKSPQIADLLYCITFQRTYQHCLRIGPFQSPSFLSSIRCKKLEGSGYEIVMVSICKCSGKNSHLDSKRNTLKWHDNQETVCWHLQVRGVRLVLCKKQFSTATVQSILLVAERFTIYIYI